MRTRFLPIFFGVVFALTLFFAVAAGAQEERTHTEGVDVQAVEIQQQQVPDNQQQILEVQQQQQVTVQAQSCPGDQTEERVEDANDFEGNYDIRGGAIRLTYEITSDTGNDDKLFIEVTDEDGDVVRTIEVDGDRVLNQREIIRASTEPGRHRFEVEAGDDIKYEVIFEDCTNVEARNGDGGGGGGGGGDGGTGDGTTDGTDDGTVDTTQDTTDTTDTTTDTTDTTTTDTTGDALETTTANNPDSVREADAFRCDFFLRAVRDDTGALRGQYRGDELIVQRFEQCLSEDVLADTIPDRNLPFTGGMSLLFLGAIGLGAIVAGVAVLRAVMRRGA